MKKEIVKYGSGKLVKFDGIERDFTVCMCTTIPDPNSYDEDGANCTWLNVENSEAFVEWERIVLFGVSVRNPLDTHKEDLAKKIAYGKAHSRKGLAIGFEYAALLSSEVADSLLNSFIKRIEDDPSLAFTDYEEQEAKWRKTNENWI